jgi:hypothetical protein
MKVAGRRKENDRRMAGDTVDMEDLGEAEYGQQQTNPAGGDAPGQHAERMGHPK